ncbi:MAG: MgtC/SapB family protein [Methylophilales bacterium]|nr:MgtC/SapB family protein [Methylophilales bacterium]
MGIDYAQWINLTVALGIGLLIGIERERNKGSGPDRSSAGIRTFTIAALLGAISITLNFWLLVASLVCVTIFATTAYFTKRNDDPGLTTEIALLFTVILGALAMRSVPLAAGLAVCTAILLAAKEPIHGFVSGIVTKDELNDLLILAAATLIVLPLVPNRFMGPYDAINPRNLWLVVILVMLIGALGHVTLRWLGGRIGLPIVGLVSGFISSTATIASLGVRAKETPNLTSAAVAGATLSNLATILQFSLLLVTIHPPTLLKLAIPLLCGGAVIAIYGSVVTLKSLHENSGSTDTSSQAVSVKTALVFASLIAAVIIVSAALKSWFGQAGLVIASGVTGLADAHASTISVASMVASGHLTTEAAVIPILAAFSSNSLAKAVMAFTSGSRTYSQWVILGLIVQVSATWMGWWLF